MATWSAKCESCGLELRVEANSEQEAIKRAKQGHEEEMSQRTQHRCGSGPFITHAWNLEEPSHPAAPRDW